MRDPLTLDFLGSLIRSVQSEQRTTRIEVASVRRELHEVERSLGDRIAGIEARLETRFDQMQSEMVRSLGEIIQVLRNGGTA